MKNVDAKLLEALEPFKRPTLLHGSENEESPLLMPLYPRHIRGIQEYLGVTPTGPGQPKP